jgi:HSP20 family protein
METDRGAAPERQENQQEMDVMNNVLIRNRSCGPVNLVSELDEAVNRLFSVAPASRAGETVRAWNPGFDLHETEDAYLIEADLPGLKQGDINITVEQGIVTIKGERTYEEKQKEKGYRRIERGYGRFQRAFRLPQNVEAGKVEAHFANGVLTVQVPKPAEAKPRQVEVKVA